MAAAATSATKRRVNAGTSRGTGGPASDDGRWGSSTLSAHRYHHGRRVGLLLLFDDPPCHPLPISGDPQIGAPSALERQRADAILQSGQNRTALMVELFRRQATGDPTLNLAISLEDKVMRLQREGALLREMKVAIGPETTVGEPPDQVRLTPPQGKRAVLRVLRQGYRWQVPAWVFAQQGQSVACTRTVLDALGPIAVVLRVGPSSIPGPTADRWRMRLTLMPAACARAPKTCALAEHLAEARPISSFYY